MTLLLSNCGHLCVCVCSVTQSCPTLCDPMDCGHQAPLSMGFSRQEYWSWLPFPSPGDLSNPGIKPASPALLVILYRRAAREAQALECMPACAPAVACVLVRVSSVPVSLYLSVRICILRLYLSLHARALWVRVCEFSVANTHLFCICVCRYISGFFIVMGVRCRRVFLPVETQADECLCTHCRL